MVHEADMKKICEYSFVTYRKTIYLVFTFNYESIRDEAGIKKKWHLLASSKTKMLQAQLVAQWHFTISLSICDFSEM